jgi:hypothetical protein
MTWDLADVASRKRWRLDAENPIKGADDFERGSRARLRVLATSATREEKPLKGANPTSATKLKDAWESSEGVKASRGWENLRTHRSPS